MKKSLIAACTAIAMVFSSLSHAETDDTTSPRKHVSKLESSDQKGHSKRWQAWVIAACVVTVGIVALVLASKHHHDHHGHHHHHD